MKNVERACVDIKMIEVGDTVRFRYYGGSSYGTERTVTVLHKDKEWFDGATKERNYEIRRYRHDSISYTFYLTKNSDTFYLTKKEQEENVEIKEKRVRFDEAGTALLASLPADKLAELYNQYVALEGVSAKFDDKTGEVVVELPLPKKNEYVPVTSNNQVEIRNKRGNILKIWTYEGDAKPLGIENQESLFCSACPTPEEFSAELAKFLA